MPRSLTSYLCLPRLFWYATCSLRYSCNYDGGQRRAGCLARYDWGWRPGLIAYICLGKLPRRPSQMLGPQSRPWVPCKLQALVKVARLTALQQHAQPRRGRLRRLPPGPQHPRGFLFPPACMGSRPRRHLLAFRPTPFMSLCRCLPQLRRCPATLMCVHRHPRPRI